MVSWADLQQDYEPSSRGDSWFDLNMAPHGQAWIWRLDRQVRAAQDAGLRVILAIYHAFPTWSGRARGGDPTTGRDAAQMVPADLGPDSPWAWFVAYLCARYRGGPNPIGPHEPFPGEDVTDYDPGSGNPLRARVDALEICNEPNALYWPQEGIAARVATMIRTATGLSRRLRGPRILAPSTLDSPDPADGSDPAWRTDWRTFTSGVLEDLRREPPEDDFRWSHHNYRDVKREVSREWSRAGQVVRLLGGERWLGDPARALWLTEGGYNTHPYSGDPDVLRAQARKLRRSFTEMSAQPGVFLFTQHGLNDMPGNDFKSGLRADFVLDGEPRPGAAKTALATWSRPHGSEAP